MIFAAVPAWIASTKSRQEDGTTKGTTKIILSFFWPGLAGSVCEPIVGVEDVIPYVIKQRAVKLVGSRARGHRDLATRLTTEFSCVDRSLNFEFLQRID